MAVIPLRFFSFFRFYSLHSIYARRSSKDAEAIAAEIAKEYGVKTEVRDIVILFVLPFGDTDRPLIDSCLHNVEFTLLGLPVRRQRRSPRHSR
jgi:hypothetical protein